MNRWSIAASIAGLGFSLVAMAASSTAAQTVPLSLPSLPVSTTDAPSTANTVLATANTTSVLPTVSTHTTASSPPIPVTVHQGSTTQVLAANTTASVPASPNNEPADHTLVPAKSSDINDLPLPPELTPEMAASAVPATSASAPANAAAATAVPATKSATTSIKATSNKAPVTSTHSSSKQILTSTTTSSAAAPVTTGTAPKTAIAPVSSTAAVPTTKQAPAAASLPLFNEVKMPSTATTSAGTTIPTVTGASTAGTLSSASVASSDSVDAQMASVMNTIDTGTKQFEINKKVNAVAKQELEWKLDQPNPYKGPQSIPLMLTNPDPGTTTIASAIRQTLATHPQILENFANQLAAQQDINQAKGGLLPSLDLNAGIGPENSMNPGTQAAGLGDVTLTRKESQAMMQQLLFDGGNVTNQIRQASATYDVSAYQVDQSKEILSYDAANAYLDVLRQRQLVEVYSYDAQAHAVLLNKITRRFEAGAGTKSDVELAQGRLAQAQAQVTQSEGDLATANDTYMRIIGVYPTVNMQKPLVPLHLPGSLAQAQALGKIMSPNIQGALAQIAAAQAAVGIAKSTFYPTVTINLTKHYDDDLAGVPGADQQSSAMVRANYNVFNGGSDMAAVSAANYRVTAAVDQARVTQRDVFFSIAESWNSLLSNLGQIHNLTIHEKQSYNVWQAYIKQFQLGQRTLWDMLNAQSEYYSAQASVVNATYTAMSSRYQLLASIGALVGTITNPEQDVFARQPLAPQISPPGEAHSQMVPQVGSNVPAPTIHLPNIN